jgi:predicted nucleotidyltransferase
MIPLIKDQLPEIVRLCEKYRVARLWLFGSAVDPARFRADSDLDFLYEFEVGEAYKPDFPYAANWSAMLDELRVLFDREIQLIAYGQFKNPWFRDSVEATKLLLYDQNAEKVAV